MKSQLRFASSKRGIVLLAAAVSLAACGGGGGGGGSGPVDDGGGDNTGGNPDTALNIQGRAVKGPLVGATVQVFQLNEEAAPTGEALAEAQTGDDGSYAVTIAETPPGPLAMVVSGGQYTDEATGEIVALGAGESFSAFVPVTGPELQVNITPLTTMAAAQARQRIRDGDGSADAATLIGEANGYVSQLLGVGDVLATAIPSLEELESAAQEERNYALFLAGVSQLDLADDQRNAAQITASLVADMEDDGQWGNLESAPTPETLVLATAAFVDAYGGSLGGGLPPDLQERLGGGGSGGENPGPVANAVQTDEDTAVEGTLVRPAGTEGAFVLVEAAANGTVEITSETDGTFVYTPNAEFNGTDQFSYQVGEGEPQVMEVTVAAVNDNPTAEGGSARLSGGTATGTLPASDPDGDALTFQIVEAPAAGTVELDEQGGFIYTVGDGAGQNDSFVYEVSDGNGGTATGTMTLTAAELAASKMVVVAHPDDEALMASGIIKRSVDAGEPIKVVIVTNGDSSGMDVGMLRQQESVNALAHLGLGEQDIIFLGYPNESRTGLLSMYNNYIAADGDAFTSNNSGSSQTYGESGLGQADYARYRAGSAAPYTKASVVADLTALFDTYMPTEIYTHSVYDQHNDHRAVYYYLVDAIAQYGNENPQFTPKVYTAIIHTPKDYPFTDKWQVNDFRGLGDTDYSDDALWPEPAFEGKEGNLPAMTARFTPTQPLTAPTHLGNTPLNWEDRISVEVPPEMQVEDLANNLKYQAILEYETQQTAHGLIFGFGKSDEVFFLNDWTDNIAVYADVQASSEKASTQQLAKYAVDGIIDGYPGNHQAEWATENGASVGETLTLTWPRPYTVHTIRLYDRPLDTKQITSGILAFSDGTTMNVGELPNDGVTPLIIALDEPKTIEWLNFEITGFSDPERGTAGLAEIEVLANVDPPANARPYFTQGPLADTYDLFPGEQVAMAAPATDPDGDALTYTWQAEKGAIEGEGAQVQYTAPAAGNVQDVITVTVDDSTNDPVTRQFVMRINQQNVAPEATIAVSSESVATQQFGAKVVDGVIAGFPENPEAEWATMGDGADAWIELTWDAAVPVNRVELYDRPLPGIQITGGTITLSDGYTQTFEAVPNGGVTPLSIEFDGPHEITSLRVDVDSIRGDGVNVGLAEMRVFRAGPP